MPMTTQSRCRACLAPEPYVFLPMGDHPPANMFVRPEEVSAQQPAFPLDTAVCLECGLVQVADQIPEGFFTHYLYVPSGADTMHGHFAETARRIATAAGDGLVVDIGCNDGLLLSACKALGCRVLGVDPAANIAESTRAKGIEVEVCYFDLPVARRLREAHGPAQVIVTTNTFNHIGDLHGFMAGVEALLAPDGTFIIEVPRAHDYLERNRFDNIYHEHVSEFSLRSLVLLARFFGMVVSDVDRLSVHGGSMRVHVRRDALGVVVSPAVEAMLEEELAGGALDRKTYDAFRERIVAVRQQLGALLDQLKREGKKVAGYGAPAKGNTLLNYFGIGPDQLDFLVDRNPLKQGLYSPGMKIPVRSTDAIATEKPDVLLVLAWNFLDEIKAQQSEFAAGGGRFLVPLPVPQLTN